MRYCGLVTAVVDVTGIPGKDDVFYCVPGAYRPVVVFCKMAGYPPVLWGHDKKVKVGRVVDLEEWLPGDRRLPGELRRLGGGGLVATMGFKDDLLGRRLWNFARRQGWLGFSVFIKWWPKDERTDGRRKRTLYVSELKEISAVTKPATYKNYLLSTREAA